MGLLFPAYFVSVLFRVKVDDPANISHGHLPILYTSS